jgi:xylulokinase
VTPDAFVIGCDVGSQGTNAALYGDDGSLVATAYETYPLSYPFPTWAEQDANDWTVAIARACRRLVAACPGGAPAIRGLSFGSQLDGLVATDASGEPVRPAMIWMDRRSEAQAMDVAGRIDPADFYRSVGANLDSSHAVFKALWIRDEEPDVWRRAIRVMPPGSFVVERLTGVAMVDYSNASSMALLDPRTKTWSGAALAATDLDPSMLPELGGGTDVVGTITTAFSADSGLDPSTVVALGCGDEMAATLGAGVYEPGEVCDVVGTAEPVCAASAEPREDPTMLVECHPHADPDAWLLENPGFVSGGNLRWWRDQFAPIERDAEIVGLGDAYDFLSTEAGHVPAGAQGVIFLPCMQGAMAPEWNGAARGVFYGLTLAHTRDHMTRAILEGSAFALRDILTAMRDAGLAVRRLTIVGGGAKGPIWRQIKADVTGLPVRVPSTVETTATGAAILAAVGAGLFGTVADAAHAFVSFQPEEHEPDARATAVYDEAYGHYRALYDALRPVFSRAAPSSMGDPA